ncbi:hypothetical protein [Oceanicoccus sp. KOV_DT_Chl]|uniref:hypothetical protein n=1 Tax=Oceanicoccus sp. KOV_DT_Chl TaxID=1904639 RepID=UPI00190E97FD|nr:hypothetical protein [Oceanicoccus sp. KOV_DT_Chl]
MTCIFKRQITYNYNMKDLTLFSLMMFTLTTSLLSACWKTLLFLVDLIDGGDDDLTENTLHYNYRTGDVEPVKHLDGLYDNKP